MFLINPYFLSGLRRYKRWLHFCRIYSIYFPALSLSMTKNPRSLANLTRSILGIVGGGNKPVWFVRWNTNSSFWHVNYKFIMFCTILHIYEFIPYGQWSFLRTSRLVSSACLTIRFMELVGLSSLTRMMNRQGPTPEPWTIYRFIALVREILVPILVYCVRSLRKETMQSINSRPRMVSSGQDRASRAGNPTASAILQISLELYILALAELSHSARRFRPTHIAGDYRVYKRLRGVRMNRPRCMGAYMHTLQRCIRYNASRPICYVRYFGFARLSGRNCRILRSDVAWQWTA